MGWRALWIISCQCCRPKPCSNGPIPQLPIAFDSPPDETTYNWKLQRTTESDFKWVSIEFYLPQGQRSASLIGKNWKWTLHSTPDFLDRPIYRGCSSSFSYAFHSQSNTSVKETKHLPFRDYQSMDSILFCESNEFKLTLTYGSWRVSKFLAFIKTMVKRSAWGR